MKSVCVDKLPLKEKMLSSPVQACTIVESKMTSRLEVDLLGPVTKLIMYVHWPSRILAVTN